MNVGLTAKEFGLLQKYIEEQCGIKIEQEKAYLIESRLSKILVESGARNFEELYYKLYSQNDKVMAERVIDAITTNETLWFRDKTPWYALEDLLLPLYIKEIREGKRFRVRIWSAACSTGQEAYSIVMSIDNYLQQNKISDVSLSQFEVIATDISPTVLEVARLARYDSISIMRGLDIKYRDCYFKQNGRAWEVDEKIKKAVTFKQFNLQNSLTLLGKFDLVFCRYVLIYFSPTLKKEVLQKIAGSLNTNGTLFLGNSEMFAEYSAMFTMEDYRSGVFYRVKEAKV